MAAEAVEVQSALADATPADIEQKRVFVFPAAQGVPVKAAHPVAIPQA
jgi:hypothetical protein